MLREQLIQSMTDSIMETCSTVLSMTAIVKELPVDTDTSNIKLPIIASIGLAGNLEGSLVVMISGADACKAISKMLGSDYTEVSQDVLDGCGEIGNILAGGLKTRLENDGIKFDISIPTVLQGTDPMNVAQLNKTDMIKLHVDCKDIIFEMIISYALQKDRSIQHKESQGEAASNALKDLIK